MALKLRPTGLGSGIDKDRADYTVYCGGWDVGRIYETRRSRQSAQVLVADCQRSDDTLRSGVNLGGGQGAVRDRLAAMAGVGEAAGNTVAPCVPLLIIQLRSRLRERLADWRTDASPSGPQAPRAVSWLTLTGRWSVLDEMATSRRKSCPPCP